MTHLFAKTSLFLLLGMLPVAAAHAQDLNSFSPGAGATFPETGNLLPLGDLQMSQTDDTNIVFSNSIACGLGGPQHLMRRFYFDEHPGVGSPAQINSVDIAIQEAIEAQTLHVNLYTIPADTPEDTIQRDLLTAIGSGEMTISPADDARIVNVPVGATVDDTESFDLVVEAAVADVFYIGATDTGESHPGFIMAPSCEAVQPTIIATLGPEFENTHIVMVVNVSEVIASEATPEELAAVLGVPVPNPVNTTTTFTVAVEHGQQVTVEVFDVTGRRVQTLFDAALAAGTTETLTLDTSSLPAGVYSIRATGEDFVETRRVTVMR